LTHDVADQAAFDFLVKYNNSEYKLTEQHHYDVWNKVIGFHSAEEVEWYAEYLEKNSSKEERPLIPKKDHERFAAFSWNMAPPKNATLPGTRGVEYESKNRTAVAPKYIPPELLLLYDKLVDNQTGRASPDATFEDF